MLLKGAVRLPLLLLLPLVAVCLLACESCHPGKKARDAERGEAAPPTVRLYFVSDVGGQLEPCGCVKDQLGGIDHLAAYVRGHAVPGSLLVSAGPLFFAEPVVAADKKPQALAKARTLGKALGSLGLVAFAPADNDFALGAGEFENLRSSTSAACVASNVAWKPGGPGGVSSVVRDVGGVRIGIVGAYARATNALSPPVAELASASPPASAIEREVSALKARGAQVVVALASAGRGEAKRIAESVPGLTAVVVGSSSTRGDQDEAPPPAERVGGVIVAQSGNHLTTLGVLDLYVRNGAFSFADGAGLGLEQRRASLRNRVTELRGRIASWQGDLRVPEADVKARQVDLEKLSRELAELSEAPAPESGSYFRYTLAEVRDSLGRDAAVAAEMAAYYKQVNEQNRALFANRLPPPKDPEGPRYVGIDTCSTCHAAARTVWNGTAHSHAYLTLSSQFKEFNLDCVGCHVTGYERPGGSNVTHVDGLKDVQCEVCHGPGSKHAEAPAKIAPPVSRPGTDMCTSCHHPPHVHEFDASRKLAAILGPGHGMPQ